MNEEEFMREHPSLKGRTQITEGITQEEGFTYDDIHETQLDKAKVREEFRTAKEDLHKGLSPLMIITTMEKELGLE